MQKEKEPKPFALASPQIDTSKGGTATIKGSRPENASENRLIQTIQNSPKVVQKMQIAEMMNSSLRTQEDAGLQNVMQASALQNAMPLQRKMASGSPHFQKVAAEMGEKYGLDTSFLKANHNSSFPLKVQAEATIQGDNIHFAPGKDTEYNIRHEVAHAIDNRINGTPSGNQMVNGKRVDTTREEVVDRMAIGLSTPHLRKQGSKMSSGGRKRVGVIQRYIDLDSEYDFGAGKIEDFHKFKVGVYGFRFNNESFVIKEHAESDEADNSKIARLGGLRAPDMRALTQGEGDALFKEFKEKIPAHLLIGGSLEGWWLMNRISGETLIKTGLKEFTKEQWIQIGKSMAHQLFSEGYDRWNFGFVGGSDADRTNMDNIMLDSDGEIAVFDTPRIGDAFKKAYRSKTKSFVKNLERDKKGIIFEEVILEKNDASRLPNPKGKGECMRQGFVSFMEKVLEIDLTIM